MESIKVIKNIESEINKLNEALKNKEEELQIAKVRHAFLTENNTIYLSFYEDKLSFNLSKKSSYLHDNENPFSIIADNYELHHSRGIISILFKDKKQLKYILDFFNIDFSKVELNISFDIDKLKNNLNNIQCAINTYESLKLKFL